MLLEDRFHKGQAQAGHIKWEHVSVKYGEKEVKLTNILI
jgi:hypothetical protein